MSQHCQKDTTDILECPMSSFGCSSLHFRSFHPHGRADISPSNLCFLSLEHGTLLKPVLCAMCEKRVPKKVLGIVLISCLGFDDLSQELLATSPGIVSKRSCSWEFSLICRVAMLKQAYGYDYWYPENLTSEIMNKHGA